MEQIERQSSEKKKEKRDEAEQRMWQRVQQGKKTVQCSLYFFSYPPALVKSEKNVIMCV